MNSSDDGTLLVHIEAPMGGTYQSYDLYPLSYVFNLRRILAEDFRLMEERICLLRGGQILSDDDSLEHNDIITAYLSLASSSPRTF